MPNSIRLPVKKATTKLLGKEAKIYTYSGLVRPVLIKKARKEKVPVQTKKIVPKFIINSNNSLAVSKSGAVGCDFNTGYDNIVIYDLYATSKLYQDINNYNYNPGIYFDFNLNNLIVNNLLLKNLVLGFQHKFKNNNWIKGATPILRKEGSQSQKINNEIGKSHPRLPRLINNFNVNKNNNKNYNINKITATATAGKAHLKMLLHKGKNSVGSF